MDALEMQALESAMGWTPEQFAEIFGIDARSLRRWKAAERQPSEWHQHLLEALRPALGDDTRAARCRLVGQRLAWEGVAGLVNGMMEAEEERGERDPLARGAWQQLETIEDPVSATAEALLAIVDALKNVPPEEGITLSKLNRRCKYPAQFLAALRDAEGGGLIVLDPPGVYLPATIARSASRRG